ncbi:spore coat protein A [Marinobacterium zhoushanense]|uniref:Spore coat protein A n=1 Tax=Marinobacterium zhoushanense TaxID=1679163 RepID=A0ABQ1K173_9GAMM|nr:multicopper oxidase domain-containing protein [Marinobacterium zhoushanense]GGB80846.1 spore coat protein A [Marinobacterium zhoushanense]
MKRRNFLTLSIRSAMAAGLTASIPLALLRAHSSHAALLGAGLSDPAMQPLFEHLAPNALASSFKYVPQAAQLSIRMAQVTHWTGLLGPDASPVSTQVWGYGAAGEAVTWPGRTVELAANGEPLSITWLNELADGGTPLLHLVPVDTSIHWAYTLPGYDYQIDTAGVPVVVHVHGGHNDGAFDGNPEYFFTPGFAVKGPRWQSETYVYGGPDWNNVAGTCWYHDHALGITRLNVYAGLAGFFIVRDEADTGLPDNPLGLPVEPYELGFAVQDRMFRSNGELFYPAFPEDPGYFDFIDEEGVELPDDLFPEGGPTALAEFFGDHMLVNGIIWPKYDVEPRQYRIRLLNGCDSRFMRLCLNLVPYPDTTPRTGQGSRVPFYVIGSDQSLRASAAEVEEVEFAPGERLDLIIDFKAVPAGSRVILQNLLGDAPFGGDRSKMDDLFPDRRTDRVMAFDVMLPLSATADSDIVNGYPLGGGTDLGEAGLIRRLALFEGRDQYGRLQPLLGTAEPTLDVEGQNVNGALPWFAPITENPALGATEIWEIYNATGDAHPIHLHLVHFEVVGRQRFKAVLVEQPVEESDGSWGSGYRLEHIKRLGNLRAPNPQEQTRRDVVMALPGEVTLIKARFDKPGRFVWHCHILSHEDHEMMRPFHVGDGPF